MLKSITGAVKRISNSSTAIRYRRRRASSVEDLDANFVPAAEQLGGSFGNNKLTRRLCLCKQSQSFLNAGFLGGEIFEEEQLQKSTFILANI